MKHFAIYRVKVQSRFQRFILTHSPETEKNWRKYLEKIRSLLHLISTNTLSSKIWWCLNQNNVWRFTRADENTWNWVTEAFLEPPTGCQIVKIHPDPVTSSHVPATTIPNLVTYHTSGKKSIYSSFGPPIRCRKLMKMH